jgi:hypothetical protein
MQRACTVAGRVIERAFCAGNLWWPLEEMPVLTLAARGWRSVDMRNSGVDSPHYDSPTGSGNRELNT